MPKSTEADAAQRLLEDTDTDSRTRVYTGPTEKVITVLLCVWVVFQLYFNTVGVMSAVTVSYTHLTLPTNSRV